MTKVFKAFSIVFGFLFNLCLVGIVAIALVAAYFLVFNPDVKYEFAHPEDEIEYISISTVHITDDGYETTEKLRIDDVDAFLADFREVSCHRKVGADTEIPESENNTDVIVVYYTNGHSEIITPTCHMSFGEERVLFLGRFVFEKQEYDSLIYKWLMKE